jgi:quinohemoprotein ethanol dehydrogenase
MPLPSRKYLPALLLAATFVSAQPRHRIDDAALKNAGKSGGEWLTYGLDQGESRYSPLNRINTTNVSQLHQAWSYDLGVGGGNQEGTPLVWNGTIYGITNWSVVFAVDARTGKEKWRWDPQVNQAAVRGKICCGVVNRGVAIYQGKIIAPIIDGRLEALDAETGRPVWESRVTYAQDNYTITMAPRIARGKVIIGMAGGELLIRGQFAAFDAETGKFAWRFYTIPGDPSKPFENPALKKAAETWSGEWWKLGGGGSVWDGMAYDPEADLFYVGTGNGGPWPEQLRQSKGKDNLFVACILAVKPETGELKWYFQPVPGDSWDFDSVQQLLLADITIKGKPRKVIMQANKDGFYYVLDRVTGQFISGKPFAQVTWAKGLDEVTGRPFVNPEAHYGNDSITISPGPGGAHNWAPMSFNPTTGLVYIPTSTNSTSNFAIDPNFTVKPGRSNTGLKPGGRGGAANPAPPAIGPAPTNGERRALVAWDPVTQTERWRAPEGGSIGGGTVTTAGNLVFQVTNDGRLLAYSADKGEKLLEVKTDLGGGMGPPVTWELDGKQYVTFAGGVGKVVPRYQDAPATGPDAPPDLAGPPSANQTTSVPPRLLTFVLDSK